MTQQVFPGYMDMGSPFIIEENGQKTIIGMFQEQLKDTAWNGNNGKALFAKLHPDTVNWIVENQDWAQDSSCYSLTSCPCGIANKPANRHKRSIQSYRHERDQKHFNESIATSSKKRKRQQDKDSNRLYNKQETLADVQNNKYPWEVNIYNRIDMEGRKRLIPCPSPDTIQTFGDLLIDQNGGGQWGGVTYDICSGSLISSRHVLTSAECVAQNRRQKYTPEHYTLVIDSIDDQDHSRQDNSKIDARYSEADCIFILMGYTNQENARMSKLFKVETVTPHPQAFSMGYNYNLGIYEL